MRNPKIRLSAALSALMIIAFFSSGCSLPGLGPGPGKDTAKPGKDTARAGVFYFIVDKSGSMAEQFEGHSKFAHEKSILERFNRAAPETEVNAALRTFGENYYDFERTELHYGIAKYSRLDFDRALRSLSSPIGNSALDQAIRAAGEDSRYLRGRVALIVMSDGEGIGESPVAAARELKKQFGPRLCIYTIQVGNDERGGKMLAQMADAGRCGAALKAGSLAGDREMKAFVERVYADAGVFVPAVPGAASVRESEKKIVAEAKRDLNGSPLKKVRPGRVFLTLQVRFDNGRADIKPMYEDEIRKVADFMEHYPETRVAIEGHTDSRGSAAMNRRLSRQRAQAVVDMLVEKFGMDRDRLKAVGYGPRRPIASNATEKGREMNRRVEARRVSR